MQSYAAAQTGFERMREVARHVGNRRLEGEALQNLANARYFQRNLPGALQAYEDRLAIERERDDQKGWPRPSSAWRRSVTPSPNTARR